MKLYQFKTAIPFKIKPNSKVLELQNQKDFEQAILDYEGNVFIGDSKAYFITKNYKYYIISYTDTSQKKKLYNSIKELLNGEYYGK